MACANNLLYELPESALNFLQIHQDNKVRELTKKLNIKYNYELQTTIKYNEKSKESSQNTNKFFKNLTNIIIPQYVIDTD